MLWDVDGERAAAVAEELGASVAPGRDAALSSGIVVTVTPGHEILFAEGSLQPGQHVSLMGADGPGKAEIAAEELARVHAFCDDWEQASHGGDFTLAVERGLVTREDATALGDVLLGSAAGRESDADITVFDSTGLAIQDLAVALAAFRKYEAGELRDVQSLTI
jgi:ornithine cyclodeaminase/alanine dehydrogenase-like protein (mu-crystallin family)